MPVKHEEELFAGFLRSSAATESSEQPALMRRGPPLRHKNKVQRALSKRMIRRRDVCYSKHEFLQKFGTSNQQMTFITHIFENNKRFIWLDNLNIEIKIQIDFI